MRAIYDGIWLMPIAVIDYGKAKPIAQAIETWLQKDGVAIHAGGLSQGGHDRTKCSIESNDRTPLPNTPFLPTIKCKVYPEIRPKIRDGFQGEAGAWI